MTPIPTRMARLPLDKHHRPVPWFVAFIDGQPDHRVGQPVRTLWYAEGRGATRAEVVASIDSGLPLLRAEAERECAPVAALAELEQMHATALELIAETGP
jgi:hypothetical protein